MKSSFTLRALTAMAVAFVFVLSSCSTSNDVVSNRAIQKRKYNDGWFLSFQKNQKKDNAEEAKADDVAIAESTPSTSEKATDASTVATASEQEVIEIVAAPAAKQKAERAKASERPANFRSNAQSNQTTDTASASNELTASDFDQEVEEAAVAAKAAKKSKGASGKSQLIALLLCIFIGGIGIHRFYLGYTWQGVVQLLTAGACGIWTLIDLIRIIMGTLEPKDGPYDETL